MIWITFKIVVKPVFFGKRYRTERLHQNLNVQYQDIKLVNVVLSVWCANMQMQKDQDQCF